MIKRSLTTLALTVGYLLLCGQSVAAQTQTSTVEEADKLYHAEKWEAAAAAYDGLTKAEPSKAVNWFRLGSALTSLGRYGEGAEAFKKAIAISHRPQAMYALAKSYALMKDKDQSFEWLTKAVENNLPQPRQINLDPGFAILRDDPRFKELLVMIDKKSHLCLNIPEYRQFDFWLGDWIVFNPAGKQVGTNQVVLRQEGCIVEENWTSAGGSTGQSFNVYNPITHRWHQSYMDSDASNWMMDGDYQEGSLRFEGAIYSPDSKVLVKMVFLNLGPDKVRQTAETSSDGGRTWVAVWDGLYVRKK